MAAMADTQADFNRYIKAYNSQVASRQYLPAARSAVGAAMACAEARNYEGAFKLLGGLEKVMAERGVTADSLPQPYFYLAKGRYDLYRMTKNNGQAEAWLNKMAKYAKESGSRDITNDMLFTEAQYYYSVGRTARGQRCIARLIKQYESGKDYRAADSAYQKLIDQAVTANDAGLVERTYESYMQWSDSIEALNNDSEPWQGQAGDGADRGHGGREATHHQFAHQSDGDFYHSFCHRGCRTRARGGVLSARACQKPPHEAAGTRGRGAHCCQERDASEHVVDP